MINFTIMGKPVGKGCLKFARRGNYVAIYTPEKTVNYENLVKYAYFESGCKPLEGALKMCLAAYFEPPQSVSKKKRQQMLSGEIRPTGKPDLDNLIKVIADALNGLAYHDDSAIVEVDASKFYAEPPKVTVSIQQIVQCEPKFSM